MANWSNPTLTSTYTNVLADLKARDEDAGKWFDGVTVSNIPTGIKRWSSSNNRFERWDGSNWVALSSTYAFPTISTIGTITGNVDTSGDAALRLGLNRSGNGYASIDLIGDTTYQASGYSVRLVRENTGANAKTILFHRGTGRFEFVGQEASSFSIATNNTARLIIDSGGGFYVNTGGATSLPGAGTTTTGFGVASNGRSWFSSSINPAVNANRNGDGIVVSFFKSGLELNGNNISISGSVVNYNTSSDYRLKEFYGPVTDALARIRQVPVHRFAYKGLQQIRDGWAAHELQQVAPYAVTGEKDGAEHQGVDAGKVVPLLWAAVQELSEQVAELRQQLATLQG